MTRGHPVPTLQERLQESPRAIWAVAAVYAVIAAVSLRAFPLASGVAAVWPASGLFLAVILIVPAERRLVTTVALGVAQFIGGLAGTTPPWPHFVFSGLIAVEAWLAAAFVEMLGKNTLRCDRLADVGRIALGACLLAAGIVGAEGAWAAHLFFGDPFLDQWRSWWLPDAAGFLVATPLALWAMSGRYGRGIVAGRLVELALLNGVLLVLALYIFTAERSRVPLSVGVLPFMIYAALRFGVQGVSVASMVLWCVAAYATLQGHGPFIVFGDTPETRIAWIHLYIVVTGGSMLAIATAMRERQLIGERLAASLDDVRDSYVRANAVIASAPGMIAATDAELHLIAFNDAWAEEFEGRFGRVPEIGLDLRATLSAVGTPLARVVLEAWTTAAAGERLTIQRGADVLGDDREFHVDYSPVRDISGRAIGVVQLVRDVTEERRRQDAEAQARRFESVGQLAGGIAHDFNNIITAILAYASLLDHSLSPTDERRADVQEIGRAASRAAELTAQLLAYARKQVVEPRTVDVNVLVRETERLLRRLIGEQLHLSVTVADDVWPVRIDPAQFEQMLVNLAINARDAMPDGGTLTVSTENVTLRAEDLPQAASGAGDYVRLTVRDTGHGIAPDVRDRIFEPFFTTKEIGKGTGLGLASVFGTIQQAGGAIDVESEPGEGATFIIFLPRDAKDAALAGGSRAVVAPGAGVGKYILLVEDEPAVLHSTTRALERAGFRVLAATSVAEAQSVMQVQGASVRVVICDEGLPDGSGQALLMRLRAEWPALGVLLTSGYAEAGMSFDGAPFIAKPYAPLDITRAVQELLDA